MKTTLRFSAVAVAVFGTTFALVDNTRAALISWTNTAGGNWSVAANWSDGVVPAAADDVQITVPGNYTVTQDVHLTVAGLTLGVSAARKL